MITIELPSGEVATIDHEVWTVPDNEELTRVLNSLAFEPPNNGYYAPSANARRAEYVLKVWGGKWLESDEHAEPGKLYLMATPKHTEKFVWDRFTVVTPPKKKRVLSYRERLQYSLFDPDQPRGDDGRWQGAGPVAGRMAALKERYPKVAENYAKDSGTEMGTIEAHTTDVGREWRTQLSPEDLSGISDRFGSDVGALMAMAIPLHDIGKPDAGRDKSKQHEHTIPILQEVLHKEGFGSKDVALATELLNHDLIGPLFRGHSPHTPHEVADLVRAKAEKVGMNVKDFATLQIAFYQADASAYPYVTQFMQQEPGGKWTFKGAKQIAPIEALTQPTHYLSTWTVPPFDLGGAGSGNFGHAGRPGEQGGSSGATSETGPGGRFEHFDQRMEVQHKLQRRLAELLPSGGTAIISSPKPVLLRTAETVLTVLEEMKAKGMDMPNAVGIIDSPHRSPHGAVSGVTIRSRDEETGLLVGERREKRLRVEMPETLPDDADLDAAVAVAFGGPSQVSPAFAYKDRSVEHYDRFAARTMKDVIVHEMGHVQAGHREGEGLPVATLLNRGTFGSLDQIRRAAMRVSEYGSKNENEFLAEAFTRLYRGETLPEDSQKLYDALNGPPPAGWDRVFGAKP